MERRLSSLYLVAMVVGVKQEFLLADAKRALLARFHLGEDTMEVTLQVLAELLLLFKEAVVRDMVLRAQGPLVLGRVPFLVTSWSRLRCASQARMLFKMRVCLE